MKKALVILMALAMVFAAFADEPDVTPKVTSFKGDATFGYKVDLDAKTFGMTNETSTELKIQWIGGEVKKSTEGDGVWGELTIKADGKQEFASGDVALVVPSVSVEVAKIHLNDMIAINILAPDLTVGKKDALFATGRTEDIAIAAVGETLTNGFTVEIAADPVTANIKVADNGVVGKSAKKIGGAADVTVKLGDFSVYAGANYVNDFAAAANASYDLALSDTMKLTPWAGLTYTNDVVWAGGALLAWGGADLEPGLDYVTDKTKDGFAVAVDSTKKFVVGAFDSVFLAPIGLKAGVDYGATFDTVAKGTLNIGVKGAWDVDVFSIAAHGGFTTNLGAKTNEYKYGVSVSNTSFVKNTTLKVAYEGEKSKKGNVVASAKISF